MTERRFVLSCRSTFFVVSSPTGSPIPTPALLTSTSRRPERSRCAATTRWTSSSSPRLPATACTSRPACSRPVAACSSFSGRRAASVTAWPSSPSSRAIASPMPLDAPVTIAARAAMSPPLPVAFVPAPYPITSAYTRRVRRPLSMVLVALLGAAIVAACGGSDDDAAPPAQPEPTAKPADFPRAEGRTLADLRAESGRSLVFAPTTVMALRRGLNRYGFALFDVAGKQVTGARVALYTARADGTGLRGPFVARSESLKVDGPFRSRTTAADVNAVKAFYVADVPFHRWGRQVVAAMAKLDGRLVMANPFTADVRRDPHGPPDVGDKAIPVHTRTLAEVGGDASRLDTRLPPATDLLQTDLADVVGRKPVVITFATPALCSSRVCGPVVDIVEQARARAPHGVAFIHQEIYQDNERRAGIQGPVAAWRLRTEPWTFVIARSGRIAARFEGAFSLGELERAIAKVT